MEWEKGNGLNNLILENRKDKFFISYTPCAFDTGNSETALVINDAKFLILDGDWRNEFTEAFPKGLEACLQVFRNNKDFQSRMTDHE